MAKKQPGLYRIPRKPGYLGGYDWRAPALGCLLLVVVNFVATQYIAAKFQYQPALGAPILRAKSGGVYLRSRMGRNNARPLWNGQSDRSVEGVSLDRAQSADG